MTRPCIHGIVPALRKSVRSTRPLCEASVPEGRRVRWLQYAGRHAVQSIQVRAAARDAERARALLAIYVSTLYAHTAQSLTAIPTIAGRAWPLHRLCTWDPKGPLVPSLARCNRYSPSREAVHPRWRALRWRASRDRSLSSHGRRATVSRRSGKAARYRSGKSTYRWRA